jgi:hypothetical protein
MALKYINRLAQVNLTPYLMQQVFRASPILDFLKRSDLYYVYERAKHYGYECHWEKKA